MKGHRQSCKFHDFLDISDIIREETQQQALPRNKWRTVWGKLGSEKMLATKGWAKTTGCIWWARQRRSRWCRGRTGSPTPPSPGATSPPPARSPTLWAQWARWVKLSSQVNKRYLEAPVRLILFLTPPIPGELCDNSLDGLWGWGRSWGQIGRLQRGGGEMCLQVRIGAFKKRSKRNKNLV